jgi:hypothetical protein
MRPSLTALVFLFQLTRDLGFTTVYLVLQLKGKIKWEETAIIMQVGVKLRT